MTLFSNVNSPYNSQYNINPLFKPFGNQNNYYNNNLIFSFSKENSFTLNNTNGFMPTSQEFFMPPQNDFWGSDFGQFLWGLLNGHPVQPDFNKNIYCTMGLNLNNIQNQRNPYLTQNNFVMNNNTMPARQAADKAVNIIMENFDSLGLPEEVKNYLSNIEFKNEQFGSARADVEKGKIIVNTNNSNVNPTDMVKLLIHESLHCVNKSPFSSKEEEFNCEKQAIQTTAQLIKSGKLDDFMIYNQSMKELGASENEALLDSSLNSWLDSDGYDNRILDSKGNVNIEQYEIHNGDVIKINGKECGKIGEYFLEGMQSSNICQFFTVNEDNKPSTAGVVVFDNTSQTFEEKQRFLQNKNNPQKIEIIRNGQIICTGIIYNSKY